jgi:SAM-dependent methyltransferase
MHTPPPGLVAPAAVDLAALLRPRDPEHASLAAHIYDSRADLRAAFGSAADAGFLLWLGVHGIREFPDLARHYPPVPPEALRATASCGASPEVHLRSGADDLRMVLDLQAVFAAVPRRPIASVLDFGCGCGRLSRWLQAALPHARRYGADVRRASIDWLAANLSGTFLANGTAPPLALPDAAVDLVVSLSVFSHLTRASCRAWIGELARVCRPDGLILLTTHGAFALAATMRSPEHQAVLGITADEARGYLRRLEAEHFLFHRAPAALIASLDGVEADYGQTFFDSAFVRAEWSDVVELLGCVPVAHVFLQDVLILRPRRPAAAGR